MRGASPGGGVGAGEGALSAPPPQFLFLPDVLQWRAHTTPDHPLFLLLNAKVSSTSRALGAGGRHPAGPVLTPSSLA